ncbi:unnamed protein product [Prorocentrum cordatum]|uniref:N-acetylgalactosaminide beta-1,3-galactosyltransferase n=1 Tax=Prorocentrum cordatum TaxID=2364126 RepID=A0ABN9PL00_9DINO|nr:unnamed protein product [Polarella glacialis]
MRRSGMRNHRRRHCPLRFRLEPRWLKCPSPPRESLFPLALPARLLAPARAMAAHRAWRSAWHAPKPALFRVGVRAVTIATAFAARPVVFLAGDGADLESRRKSEIHTGFLENRHRINHGSFAGRDTFGEKSSSDGGNDLVCFFVTTDTVGTHGDGRSRAEAVATTWAAEPSNRSRVYYFVDEQTPPYHLPSSITPDRVIQTIGTDYDHLPDRTRVQLLTINTKQLKDSCNWFALVDDDTYVNTDSVVAKASRMDATKLHYMGAIYNYNNGSNQWAPFVHGDFKMFSRAAVPLVAEAVAKCDEWGSGMEDVEIAKCFAKLDMINQLPPETFGDSVHDNERGKRPTTLQQAFDISKKSSKSLKCLDFLHKLLPEDMHTFSEEVSKSPACATASSSLIHLSS